MIFLLTVIQCQTISLNDIPISENVLNWTIFLTICGLDKVFSQLCEFEANVAARAETGYNWFWWLVGRKLNEIKSLKTNLPSWFNMGYQSSSL